MRYDDARTRLPAFSKELLQAVIGHAHDHSLPVALHQIYRRDLLEVLDLPFDTLEHIPIDEPLTEAEAEALARRSIPISTTMMTYGIVDHVERLAQLLAREPGRFEEKPRRFLEQATKALAAGENVSRFIGREVMYTGSTFQRESLRRLHAAGAIISYGTDSGGAVTPPGCPHWELLDMVRAGLSSLEALRAATTTAAAAVGRPDLGRIGPGALADLVLLARNPLEEIGAIGEVVAVFQEGRLSHVSSLARSG
jgi:imidazolonepropionase-like amidohydrolase